jgi:hypothetical protein
MTKRKSSAAAASTRKQADKTTAKAVEANSGLPTLSESEVAAARVEGMKEAVKESAKDAYKGLTDGVNLDEPPARQFIGKDDIMAFEPLLSLGVKEFEARIAEKSDNPVPEEKVAGLLELERSGQNRTPYVQAMCKRLNIKSPYEVTSAGPGYTNDVHPVTEL